MEILPDIEVSFSDSIGVLMKIWPLYSPVQTFPKALHSD